MKFIVVYYDKNGTPMQNEVNTFSRDMAFRITENQTGCEAICEKWELMDKKRDWTLPASQIVETGKYPTPSTPVNKAKIQRDDKEKSSPLLSTKNKRWERPVKTEPQERRKIIDSVPFPFNIFAAILGEIFGE